MTWQRIDENTYFDDTLVTCAEYQLFIDEMREQGKYYQPDHWLSYQFPEGHAREPILGVRHSDAMAFCEWLTQREANGWKFRLLTKIEANKFPLKYLKGELIGYWVLGKYQFVREGPFSEYAHGIEIDIDFPRDLETALDRARNLSLNIDRVLANHSIDRTSGKEVIRALDPLLAIDPALDPIECVRDRALDISRAIGMNLASDLVLDWALFRTIEQYIHLLNKMKVSSADDLDRAENHLSALQELCGRIKGYSDPSQKWLPSSAFEGIRLVKERIK